MTATRRDIRGLIRENVPLAPFTSFGIGGPARYFVEVASIEQLGASLSHAARTGVPWYILAGGTNVLISDSGFDGLVIKMNLEAVTVQGDGISAQAGAGLDRVVDLAAEAGLSGVESLSGIPGTLGGAVRGNAGAYGTTISDVVRQVLVLDAGTMEQRWVYAEQCAFGYRSSLFKKNRNLIVISADLELSRGNRDAIREKMTDILTRRGAIMEKEMSVGSYFMNVVPSEEQLIRKFEEDKKIVCRNCMIPAGWFIDKAGLRGTRIGGAMVSEKHGNYLINTGQATAADVLELAMLIKREVKQQMGVELLEEVNYVGFS